MEKNTQKSRSPFDRIKQYSLKAIQLIVIFIILDMFSTFLAIQVFHIAKEMNPIARALWEDYGFGLGSGILIAMSLSSFVFLYFAVLFAPIKEKLGKVFLIFSGVYLCFRIIMYMLVLVNNYAILTEFFLSKI